jgi:tetratricopeptide (TPR) repeat protein
MQHRNRWSYRIAVLGCLFALAAFSASARAQSNADSDAKAKARQLYDDGVTNYNLGHYQEALTSFENGYRFRHDPSFLFNIAQCQRNLKRYEDAERTYRAYLRESPELSDDARERIQKFISDMEKAIEVQRGQQSQTGAQSSEAAGTARQPSATPSSSSSAAVNLTATAPAKRPVYKRGWFWGVMAGVAVVAVGVGVGVGLGVGSKSNPFSVVQF